MATINKDDNANVVNKRIVETEHAVENKVTNNDERENTFVSNTEINANEEKKSKVTKNMNNFVMDASSTDPTNTMQVPYQTTIDNSADTNKGKKNEPNQVVPTLTKQGMLYVTKYATMSSGAEDESDFEKIQSYVKMRVEQHTKTSETELCKNRNNDTVAGIDETQKHFTDNSNSTKVHQGICNLTRDDPKKESSNMGSKTFCQTAETSEKTNETCKKDSMTKTEEKQLCTENEQQVSNPYLTTGAKRNTNSINFMNNSPKKRPSTSYNGEPPRMLVEGYAFHDDIIGVTHRRNDGNEAYNLVLRNMVFDKELEEEGFSAYMAMRDKSSGKNDTILLDNKGYPRFIFMSINVHHFNTAFEGREAVKKQCENLRAVSTK